MQTGHVLGRDACRVVVVRHVLLRHDVADVVGHRREEPAVERRRLQHERQREVAAVEALVEHLRVVRAERQQLLKLSPQQGRDV